MKKVLFFILLTSGVSAFVVSCKKSSIEVIAGAVVCDTSAVSYTHDVVPILQEYCYNCHGAHVSADGGGIILEGYANLEQWVAQLDKQIEGILLQRLSHIIQIWCAELDRTDDSDARRDSTVLRDITNKRRGDKRVKEEKVRASRMSRYRMSNV